MVPPQVSNGYDFVCETEPDCFDLRYRPRWFRKYNFLLSAALDGGTQVIFDIWWLWRAQVSMFDAGHGLRLVIRCGRCLRKSNALPYMGSRTSVVFIHYYHLLKILNPSFCRTQLVIRIIASG